MSDWTPTDRALLRALPVDVGHCIATPARAIEGFRQGHGSGGGHGFVYEYGRTAITGAWHEWIPIAWATTSDRRPTGQPIKWRTGRLLREARVTYPRLQRWCESLPAEIRDRASAHWRTAPVCTRDLPALLRLVVAVLDGDLEPPPPMPTQSTLF